MSMSQEPQFNPYASPTYSSPASRQEILARVSAPAIALMIVSGLGIAIQALNLALQLLGLGLVAAAGNQNNQDMMASMVLGTIQLVFSGLSIVIGGVIIWGALKMQKLQNYGAAMSVTVLAMIPCLSPCCLFGLPIGIWGLVVLMNDDVKRAFE